MPTFIKSGYWEKLEKGFKNYLNLDKLIRDVIGTLSVGGLTDLAEQQ